MDKYFNFLGKIFAITFLTAVICIYIFIFGRLAIYALIYAFKW